MKEEFRIVTGILTMVFIVFCGAFYFGMSFAANNVDCEAYMEETNNTYFFGASDDFFYYFSDDGEMCMVRMVDYCELEGDNISRGGGG